MYVAIHELAHVTCNEIGHTPKFWAIYDALIRKAAKNNLINSNVGMDSRYMDVCNVNH